MRRRAPQHQARRRSQPCVHRRRFRDVANQIGVIAGSPSAKTRFALLPGHDGQRGGHTETPTYVFFFTSLMLEKTMPSARSLV